MKPGPSGGGSGQGIIRVQSQSPYEELDPTLKKWFVQLKSVWSVSKESSNTTLLLNNFFSASKNPYVSALQAMMTCGDFYSGKQNSRAYYIMVGFEKWIKENPNVVHLLSKDIKFDAFDLVIRQKNQSLINLVAKIYKMVEDKEIFINPLMDLIALSKYKEACQCAATLELHNSFKIEDFVIQLVFQDKFTVAEKFLEGSKQHQIKLVTFLDDLLERKNIEADAILRNMKISGVNPSRLDFKPLGKLIFRLVKTFNLPTSICPNLIKKREKGVLNFLLKKKYVEKTLGNESWEEMVLEVVGADENLQLDLVKGAVLFGDMKEALTWAGRFKIPECYWPFKLKEFSRRLNEESSSACGNASEEKLNEMKKDVPKMHKLPLKESQIYLIDTTSDFLKFTNEIANGVKIVGLDAEWKPCFGFNKCDLSLFQVATHDCVYILDFAALGAVAPETLWKRFCNVLLGNPNIIKLGFGIDGDLTVMRATLSKFHHDIKVTDASFLDLGVLWKILVNDHNFVFPYPAASSSTSPVGLNTFIELCLGEKLDKSDQFSNWEKRPLRQSQIIYAALDAYCLLEAYDVIVKESKCQNIPIFEIQQDIINKIESVTTKKKKGVRNISELENRGTESSSGMRKSITEIRVVCDSMLVELGKELRKFGVDTIILVKGEELGTKKFDRSGPLFVLTQRKIISGLKKYGEVFEVKSSRLRDQFYEVLNLFNAEVPKMSLNSRCLECNSTEFEIVTRKEMRKLSISPKPSTALRPAEEFPEVYSSEFCDDEEYEFEDDKDWFSNSKKWSCSQEPLDYSSLRTKSGALIRVDAIHPKILDKVPIFYVCVQCGKCFWKGSHKKPGLRGFKFGDADQN